MNKLTLTQAINQAMRQIDRLDAQLLLAHALNKPRSYLFAWPDQLLPDKTWVQFQQWVEQRAGGYPLAYLTGTKSFWDMDLIVTPDVLIPRPETELLVEMALSRLSSHQEVLELATGSGAIACALAKERTDLNIIASDISHQALNIAQRNAAEYDLNHIHFIQSDWFTNIPEKTFDMIIANPPYLADTDPHLSTDIRFEPRQALVSGKHGDEDYIHIISQATHYLKPNAYLLLEHGCEQGMKVRELLENNHYKNIATFQDLAGLDRVTLGQL